MVLVTLTLTKNVKTMELELCALDVLEYEYRGKKLKPERIITGFGCIRSLVGIEIHQADWKGERKKLLPKPLRNS